MALRAETFPESMQTYIRKQYKPLAPINQHWDQLKGAVEETLRASAVRGDDSMRKHVTHLAYFFAWAHSVGLPLDPSALTRHNVGRYDQEELATGSRSTPPWPTWWPPR